MSREDLTAILAGETEPHRKLATFGALLTRESGLGTEGLTIVGGSALEIYTTGDYVSGDIDIVAERPEKVEEVLQSWGFTKEEIYWQHRDLGLVVQIVGRYDSGSRTLNQIVAIPYGRLRLGSMEDLVWKRVYESRGWNRPVALDEAMLLALRYSDRLDWEYLERKAKENGVEDLMADLRRVSTIPRASRREVTRR